jgi:hypothetical protein
VVNNRASASCASGECIVTVLAVGGSKGHKRHVGPKDWCSETVVGHCCCAQS